MRFSKTKSISFFIVIVLSVCLLAGLVFSQNQQNTNQQESNPTKKDGRSPFEFAKPEPNFETPPQEEIPPGEIPPPPPTTPEPEPEPQPKPSIPIPKKSIPVPKVSIPTPKESPPTPKISIPTPKESTPTPKPSAPTPTPKISTPKVPTPKESIPVPKKSIPTPKPSAPIVPPDPIPPKCVTCKCSSSKNITVPVVRYEFIQKLKPYIVYYDASKKNNVYLEEKQEIYNLKKRFNFVHKLRVRISVMRGTIAHFRHVIQRLLVQKKITQKQYTKMDELLKKKTIQFEREVKSESLTLGRLDKEIHQLNQMLHKMGFAGFAPKGVCKTIGKKRVCNLHATLFAELNHKIVVQKSKKAKELLENPFKVEMSFLKSYMFTNIYYYKMPSQIKNLKKNLKKNTVTFVREGSHWVEKSVTVHSKVQDAVWSSVIPHLYNKNKALKSYVFALLKRKLSKKQFKKLNKSGKKDILKKILNSKRLKKNVSRHIRANHSKYNARSHVHHLLEKDVQINKLIKQYKSKVKRTVRKGLVTKEIMLLPKKVLKLDNESLKQLIGGKIEIGF